MVVGICEEDWVVKHLASLALALVIGLVPSAVYAQDAWPSRVITFIVPYGAGGYTDLVGRMTASFVEKELGKSVVIENRAGGGGIVGTGAVARSAPDGHFRSAVRPRSKGRVRSGE